MRVAPSRIRRHASSTRAVCSNDLLGVPHTGYGDAQRQRQTGDATVVCCGGLGIADATDRPKGTRCPPSKLDARPPVYDTAVERRPRIDGPTSILGAARPDQRTPLRLVHVPQILRIHEEAQTAEPTLEQPAEQHIRFADVAERIVLEALTAGEEHF